MFKYFVPIGLAALLLAGCGAPDQGEPTVQSTPRQQAGAKEDAKLASSETESASTPDSNRLQVRSATLRLRVDSIDTAEKKVDAAIKSADGYLATVSSDDLASPNATLKIEAKVPVAHLDDTIAKVEGFGTRLSKTVSMQDVTDDVAATDAAIKVLKIEEQGAHGVGLNNVEARLIAEQAARDAQLKRASFATFDLALEQGAMPGNLHDPNWLAQAYGSASTSAGEAFRVFATGMLWLMFFSPFYVPVIIAAWLIRRGQKRKLMLRHLSSPPKMSPAQGAAR